MNKWEEQVIKYMALNWCTYWRWTTYILYFYLES